MTDEFDPLTGDPLPKHSKPPETAQDTPDLSALEGLSKDELIALVGRMARQCGMVACMTEEETAQAMLDRLAHVALTAGVKDAVGAINAWLDRVQGRPTQRIEQRTLEVHVDIDARRQEARGKAEQLLTRLATISGNAHVIESVKIPKPLKHNDSARVTTTT